MQLSKAAIASVVAALTLLAGVSVAQAGTVTTTVESQSSWPTYTDDPGQGGTLLGPSQEVCGSQGQAVSVARPPERLTTQAGARRAKIFRLFPMLEFYGEHGSPSPPHHPSSRNTSSPGPICT